MQCKLPCWFPFLIWEKNFHFSLLKPVILIQPGLSALHVPSSVPVTGMPRWTRQRQPLLSWALQSRNSRANCKCVCKTWLQHSLSLFVSGKLLQGMCVFSLSVVYDYVTPWAVAHQAPLSMEFSRQEHWSGLPCPPPGDLPNPGVKPKSPTLHSSLHFYNFYLSITNTELEDEKTKKKKKNTTVPLSIIITDHHP